MSLLKLNEELYDGNKLSIEGINYLQEVGLIKRSQKCAQGHQCILMQNKSVCDGWVWR